MMQAGRQVEETPLSGRSLDALLWQGDSFGGEYLEDGGHSTNCAEHTATTRDLGATLVVVRATRLSTRVYPSDNKKRNIRESEALIAFIRWVLSLRSV
jgi:hypothetical protein